jgi:hypothetical protein
MTPEKTLYTDGHEVTVTDSSFKVRKTLYHLRGITRHSFQIIHPDRLPALFLAIAGAMMITLSAFHLIPKNVIPDVALYSLFISGNTIALALGIGFMIAGSLILAVMKDRYAVRIATAEGEKNVVVSNRKEYVAQIIEALNKALLNLVMPSRERSEEWKDRMSREIFSQKSWTER